MSQSQVEFKDPYNWKMPGRSDLMSLDTIKQVDVGYDRFHASSVRNLKLDTRDITGSQPLLKSFIYTNKESFVNRNDDIEGTRSKSSIKQLFNKPDLQLKNEDIKGTKSRINQFETTRNPSNPNMPVYKLQSYETIEPIYTKFVRDSFQTTDIDGAKPTSKVFKPRNQDIYTEVDGSKPRKRVYDRKDPLDSLNVKDINNYYRFQSNRSVNPLEPIYKGQIDESRQAKQFGEVEGSKSIRLHPINKISQDFSINTRDIPGAWADTHADLFLRRDQRKDYRISATNLDIENSQPHSLKKGLQTIRQTDPLMPRYNFPGDKEEQKQLFPLTASNIIKKQEHFGRKAGITLNRNESNKDIGPRTNILSQPIQEPKSTVQKFDQFVK